MLLGEVMHFRRHLPFRSHTPRTQCSSTEQLDIPSLLGTTPLRAWQIQLMLTLTAHSKYYNLWIMWHWKGGTGNLSQKQKQSLARRCHISFQKKRQRHLTKLSPTLRGSPGQESESGQAAKKLVFLTKQLCWETSISCIFAQCFS